MHIPFSSSTEIKTSEGTIWDYDINKDVGVSYQELHARGPSSGNYLNTVCHEIYFIIEGSATFVINGTSYSVQKNDVVVVEPHTPHHIETNNLRFITITRPDWYEEQSKQVS